MTNNINIKELTKEDIGRNVTYTPFEGCDSRDLEHGHITSFNESNIFVDYGNSCGRGIATSPSNLKFIF